MFSLSKYVFYKYKYILVIHTALLNLILEKNKNVSATGFILKV
jgi:hypothetical protein